jgi:putative spermidine/putrescine transport system permease protein
MTHAISSPRRSHAAGTKEHEDLIVDVVLLAPALLLIAIVFLLPLAMVLMNSVLTREGLSLFYFSKFLSDPYYLGVLWRTFRLGLIGMLVTLVPGYILAYNMVFHPSRRFRLLIVAVTMVPLVINLLVRVFGWIAILSSQGTVHELLSFAGLEDVRVRLLYTESAIVIGSVHSHLTFMALPIAATLSKIDLSLLRAAQNLGAGPWQSFFRVALPLSLPGIVAGSLLCFALNISDFVSPILLGGERLRMMTYLIYEQQLFLANDSFAAAQTVILMTASLIAIFGGLRLASLFSRRFGS